ncbi:hypothetical protein CDL15_Pgr028985 [Punica granatum]|uniref:Uncharacterized protein n=1 Tax=Punica granatum TaxID=22663 RepID=A0A218XMN6_PUNGR|nr:hypothetical protein CDL15_Pgr028985 [Punica granatum]
MEEDHSADRQARWGIGEKTRIGVGWTKRRPVPRAAAQGSEAECLVGEAGSGESNVGGRINTWSEGNCCAEGTALDGGSPNNEIDGKWKEAMGHNIGESGGRRATTVKEAVKKTGQGMYETGDKTMDGPSRTVG